MADNPLKGCVPLADFCAFLGVSKPMVAKMLRDGSIQEKHAVKQGRKLYIHKANAKADLATLQLGVRGKTPVWVKVVGNKEGIARLKAAEKAAKAADKAASKLAVAA